MKKWLVAVAACGALVSGSRATPLVRDEGAATNSTSLTGNLKAIADAKAFNEDYALMSLTLDPLQQVCQILAENDCASTITSLGQVSIHLASRILRRMGAYDNPNSRQAIRVDLRKAIKAREARTAAQSPKGEKEKAPFLTPWRVLLGEDVSLRTLCQANDILSFENLNRLWSHGLLDKLTKMDDKKKALALGACATQIFTAQMDGAEHAMIIRGALQSSWPLSEYAVRSAACRQHFFTAMMSGFSQAYIMQMALESSRPLPSYAARRVAFNHIATIWMGEWTQARIIARILPLSDAQMAQLVDECAERRGDDAEGRRSFICKKAQELQEEQ